MAKAGPEDDEEHPASVVPNPMTAATAAHHRPCREMLPSVPTHPNTADTVVPNRRSRSTQNIGAHGPVGTALRAGAGALGGSWWRNQAAKDGVRKWETVLPQRSSTERAKTDSQFPL